MTPVSQRVRTFYPGTSLDEPQFFNVLKGHVPGDSRRHWIDHREYKGEAIKEAFDDAWNDGALAGQQ